MKLWYSAKKPYLSQAFRRIEEGLKLTAPSYVEWVENEHESDFNIRPIINWKDFQEPAPKDVCLQLCYITAGQTPEWWMERWAVCKLVASYLYLPTDYLAMPLGYDPQVFFSANIPKKYRAITTGYVDGPGNEFIKVVWEAFGNVLHLGADLKLGKGYNHAEKISDSQLRAAYQASEYVVSLRDVEGFELPIIEGAACGALPVALDLPCYRRWFPATTLFVRPDHLLEDLQRIAQEPAIHVPSVKRFEWKYVMKEFWERLC